MRAVALRGSARRFRLPKMGVGPQVIAVLLVLGLVGAMAIEPTRQLIEQRERISGMDADLRRIERSNDRLEARISRLNDPDYLEQRAREIGLVREGETPYVVMPLSPEAAGRKQSPAARERREPAPSNPGFFEGMLHFLGVR